MPTPDRAADLTPDETRTAPAEARPSFRVAAFGLGAQFQRVAEIVFRHARHNPYRYTVVPSRTPEDFDLALIDMTAKGSGEVARTLLGLPRSHAIVKVGRREDPTRACDDLVLQRFALNLLAVLNQAVERHLLPARAGESQAAIVSRRAEPDALAVLGRRPRVLLIDESPRVRRQVTLALSGFGLDSEGVSCAQQAREVLAVRSYELAIIELDLPTDEALTLIRDLKRDPALKSMQVLALTRRSSPWDKLRAGWCGVDAYLVKPVSMQVLQETVGRSVQRALNHALKAQAGSTQQGSAAGASA